MNWEEFMSGHGIVEVHPGIHCEERGKQKVGARIASVLAKIPGYL